jgi:hypothetical protein
MRIENSPSAYGFLAGMAVLLAGLLIVNSGCALPAPAAPEMLEGSRTATQRNEAAVGVYTECGSGSGVLVDGAHVLTAFHVVDCGDDEKHEPAQWIVIRTYDDKSSVVTIDVADPDRDLARLKLETPIVNVAPARIRASEIGDVACAWTVVPERATRCGEVTAFETPRAYGDATVTDMNVWYGNSGSGAYGEDGSLIGIVVRLKWCTPGDGMYVALTGERVATCGGRVSSITDSPVNW